MEENAIIRKAHSALCEDLAPMIDCGGDFNTYDCTELVRKIARVLHTHTVDGFIRDLLSTAPSDYNGDGDYYPKGFAEAYILGKYMVLPAYRCEMSTALSELEESVLKLPSLEAERVASYFLAMTKDTQERREKVETIREQLRNDSGDGKCPGEGAAREILEVFTQIEQTGDTFISSLQLNREKNRIILTPEQMEAADMLKQCIPNKKIREKFVSETFVEGTKRKHIYEQIRTLKSEGHIISTKMDLFNAMEKSGFNIARYSAFADQIW